MRFSNHNEAFGLCVFFAKHRSAELTCRPTKRRFSEVISMRSFIRWTSGLLLLACVTVGVAMWQLRAREAMKAWDPDTARAKHSPLPVRTVKVDAKELEE